MLRKEQLTASPACFPTLQLELVLQIFRDVGFKSFEPFADWAASAFDWRKGPEEYLKLGRKYGLRYTSVHLPTVRSDEADSLDHSVKAAFFAQELGAAVVIFKAKTVEDYIQNAVQFLDRTEQLSIVPVITNHSG